MVTGAGGFIGSHLVDALLAAGAEQVRVVDSLAYGSRKNLPCDDPRVQIHNIDLGEVTASDLYPICDGARYVFHLAAEKHNASIGDPNRMLRSNVQGTLNIVQAAADRRCAKLLFTSSLYAYGRLSGPPFREDEVLRPSTVYGTSKVAGEHLTTLSASAEFETVVVRYLFVYGPRQWANAGYKSVIVKNFERMMAGEQPLILGSGTQALDYIYVSDAVQATIKALTEGANQAVYNIGSGRATDIRTLTSEMIDVAGWRGATAHGPADWTEGSHRVGDISKITRELGWEPQVSLREGLQRTLAWMRERGTYGL